MDSAAVVGMASRVSNEMSMEYFLSFFCGWRFHLWDSEEEINILVYVHPLRSTDLTHKCYKCSVSAPFHFIVSVSVLYSGSQAVFFQEINLSSTKLYPNPWQISPGRYQKWILLSVCNSCWKNLVPGHWFLPGSFYVRREQNAQKLLYNIIWRLGNMLAYSMLMWSLIMIITQWIVHIYMVNYQFR